MIGDKVFKALSDPTRRQILKLLNKREMTAGEIAERFDVTGATISHHLSVLKEADAVSMRRNGKQLIYSVNTTVMQDVLAFLMDVFGDRK